MRYVILSLAFLCCSFSQAGSVREESAISFRMAKYSFSVRFAGANDELRPLQVEWAYPVFVGERSSSTQKLNAWLRRISLEALFDEDQTPLNDALKLNDRELVRLLTGTIGNVTQSVVRPHRAFGEYRTFKLNQEVAGATRPQHGIHSYIYSVRLGRPVEVASLFKPSAAGALSDLLQSTIDAETPSCIQRKFDWNFVEVEGPSEVFLEFPYAPVEWRECGDGVYQFHGSAVRRQIISPEKFVPERKLIEVP